MKTCFLFGLTLSVVSGCSSAHHVDKEPAPDKWSFAQVNANARDHHVFVLTTEGEEVRATDLFVGADSTTFIQSATGKRIAIPTSSVNTITINKMGAGAVDGLLWGSIVGAPSGLALGSFAAELADNGESMDWAVVAGFTAGGAVLGGCVGAIIGHDDEYIFTPKSDSSQKDK